MCMFVYLYVCMCVPVLMKEGISVPNADCLTALLFSG